MLDTLWDAVNLRNDLQHFQDGLFIWDVPTFNEIAVRETVLNAVSHRDYRLAGSVFVRQFPRRIEIVTPCFGSCVKLGRFTISASERPPAGFRGSSPPRIKKNKKES